MFKRSVLAVAVCAAMTLSMAGCAGSSNSASSSGAASSSSSSAQASSGSAAANAGIANPWVDYATLADAEDAAGFTLELPFEIIPGDEIRAIEGEIIEVVNTVGGSTTVRKIAGHGDASGDYNSYPYVAETDEMVFKGDSEDEICLVTWTDGDYSYSIAVGDPVTAEDIANMASRTK